VLRVTAQRQLAEGIRPGQESRRTNGRYGELTGVKALLEDDRQREVLPPHARGDGGRWRRAGAGGHGAPARVFELGAGEKVLEASTPRRVGRTAEWDGVEREWEREREGDKARREGGREREREQ
jgi:hypothetical protein